MGYLDVLPKPRREARQVDDVPGLLAALGMKTHPCGASEHRTHCPNPEHPKRPGPGSWQIVVRGPRAGRHVCYAGCGFGGGPIRLIATVLGIDDDAARDWLDALLGPETVPKVRTQHWSAKRAGKGETAILTLPDDARPLYDNPDRELEPAIEYLATRGVTPAEIRAYEIHAMVPRARGYGGRLIIPVVVQNELVDFVARLYVPAPAHMPKALSARRELGARKELVLWGFDALSYAYPFVHVVEGVWGALAALRLGIRNVVAACGSAWSPERTALLEPWERVVLIPDGDAAGSKIEQRASSLRFAHDLFVAELPPGEQPDTVGPELPRYIALARPARFVSALATESVPRAYNGKGLID